MARVRLTRRKRRAAEAEPYPGMVGQPDRTFEPMDEYNSEAYKQKGWYYPDDSDDWKNEERNEIGVGIPREDGERAGDNNPVVRKAHIQRIRQAAGKAVKLAVLLLGDKSPEEVVEAQARDFMRLGDKGLDEALKRYAETETLYAESEEKKEEDEAKGEEEAAKTVQEEVEEDAKKKAEDDEEEAPAEAKKKSEEDEDEAKKAEDGGDQNAEANNNESIGVPAKAGELDIEMVAVEAEAAADPEADSLLTKLYAEDEEDDADEEACDLKKKKKSEDDEDDDDDEDEDEGAKKKAGVQTLGGQPKVAASENIDLGGLWNSAPDVSDVFNS